ncbi:MAG: DUF5668 domain-containing protein [Vicinamibacterales bacterium]
MLVGVGLMLAGIVLVFDRTGLIDAGRIFRFWPLILIAVGVQQLSWAQTDQDGVRPARLGAFAWIGVGGVLLLNTLGLTRVSIFELFWPALLIFVGFPSVDACGSRPRMAVGTDRIRTPTRRAAVIQGLQSPY